MLHDIDLPDQATLYPNLPDTLPAAHEDSVTMDADDATTRVATAVEATKGSFS